MSLISWYFLNAPYVCMHTSIKRSLILPRNLFVILITPFNRVHCARLKLLNLHAYFYAVLFYLTEILISSFIVMPILSAKLGKFESTIIVIFKNPVELLIVQMLCKSGTDVTQK